MILVERPESGDPSRRFPGLFAAFNRGKRSVALDLKSRQGRNRGRIHARRAGEMDDRVAVPPMNGLPIRILPPPEPAYGLFATADGRQITLSIAGEDAMWISLCRMLGLEQFAGFDEQHRVDRRHEIDPLLRVALRQWPYQALVERLELDGVQFGPVCRAHEVFADPQLASRRMTVEIDGPSGRSTFIRQPMLFDGAAGQVSRPVPQLGQHNADLLQRRPISVTSA